MHREPSNTSRVRLIIGGSLWGVTRFSPFLVPWVQRSDLSESLKLALSGLLFFGIPELFMLVAIAIMGREGYRLITGLVFRILRKGKPAEHVSRLRYRIGLVLFAVPVLFAILSPYVAHLIPNFDTHARIYAMCGDGLLLISLFVLGGQFWDKLRSLFVHRANVSFPAKADG